MSLDEEKREYLGREVRNVWVAFAREQADPKPAHLLPWAELDEANKEVDRRIGEHIAEVVTHDYARLVEDVKALHDALNAVLPLFVLDRGYDYNCVVAGLKALARHPELPTDARMVMKIREWGYDQEASSEND